MSIPEYVKDFVNAYLEYCGSPLKVAYVNTIPQKYIQNDNVALHDYYLDILVTLSNNEIYNIEIYNDFGSEQCKKSVAYTMTFRAKDRNLEASEVNAITDKIIAGLQKMGIELRG